MLEITEVGMDKPNVRTLQVYSASLRSHLPFESEGNETRVKFSTYNPLRSISLSV